MATITRVRRKNLPDTVDVGAISRAAQAGRTVAGAFGAVAEQQQFVDNASAKSEVARANADLNRQYNEIFDQNTVEFSTDPRSATSAFELSLGESSKSISDNLTSDLAKNMFSQTSLDISSRYKLKHDVWGNDQVKKNAVSDIDSTATEYSNQSYEAGTKGDFNQFLQIQGLTQDVVVAASGIVAENQLSKISETTAKDNTVQFLAGMTRDNPDDAIAMLDSGQLDDVLSLEERDELKGSANVRKKEMRLAQKAGSVAVENELLLSLEDPTVDSFSKTLDINKKEITGQISKPFAVQARRLVQSKKAVDALTINEDMAEIITSMYDLNAIAEIDASGYLDGINSINIKIAKMRADGKLSASDAVKMQNQMKTLTAAKVAGATQDVAIFYMEASEVFKTLPPENRGLAMRQMFYATEGNFDLSKQEMIDTANGIVDIVNKANRDSTLRSVSAVIGERNVRTEEDALFIKSEGISEADLKETMALHGMTEQQVLQKLRSR